MTTRPLWFDRLIDGLAVVAGALLCVLVILICIDVAGRSTGGFTIPWTLDLSEFALYAITFLAAPWVLREQGHIAIEIFVEKLPSVCRRLATVVANIAGTSVCAILLTFSTIQLWRSYVSGNLVYETFVYAEWYQYAIAPPVFLMLLILFLKRLFSIEGSTSMLKEGL